MSRLDKQPKRQYNLISYASSVLHHGSQSTRIMDSISSRSIIRWKSNAAFPLQYVADWYKFPSANYTRRRKTEFTTRYCVQHRTGFWSGLGHARFDLKYHCYCFITLLLWLRDLYRCGASASESFWGWNDRELGQGNTKKVQRQKSNPRCMV